MNVVSGFFVFLGVFSLVFSVGTFLRKVSDGKRIPWGTILILLIVAVGFFTTGSAIGIIPTGNTGIVLRWGALTSRQLSEGLYLVRPFAESVQIMSSQVHAVTVEASSASKDMQTVHATITLNYQLDPARAGEIYRIMRQDYKTRAIDPAIQEGVKAATAQFDAEQLIAKRESVRMAIKEILTAKLTTPFGIRIIDVSITDFNFSPEFNAAIEAKAKATQEAETARRNLEKVKMEQAAQVEIAKAQAESLRLQRQNVTPELVRLRALEVQKAWVEKWDGKMPVTMMGSNTPVIMNLPNQ